MDRYPRKSRSTPHELVELTEDLADEYNGFIEFISSDTFTLWLADLAGRRKIHIGHIVSALHKDCFISQDLCSGGHLTPELYEFLVSRLNELIEEGLLRRTNGRVNLLHLREKPIPPPVYHPKKVREHAQSPETLEQRINAAHIASQAIHSHTVNDRMK